MYSALQQQCLQQLGISFYQLKPDLVDTDKPLMGKPRLDWQQVPKQLMTDLKVLFPNMQIVGEQLKLNANVSWLLFDEEKLTFTDSVIKSSLPNLMSVTDKKQLWQALAGFCSDHHE